jgi:hypothetical protein
MIPTTGGMVPRTNGSHTAAISAVPEVAEMHPGCHESGNFYVGASKREYGANDQWEYAEKKRIKVNFIRSIWKRKSFLLFDGGSIILHYSTKTFHPQKERPA